MVSDSSVPSYDASAFLVRATELGQEFDLYVPAAESDTQKAQRTQTISSVSSVVSVPQ